MGRVPIPKQKLGQYRAKRIPYLESKNSERVQEEKRRPGAVGRNIVCLRIYPPNKSSEPRKENSN